MTISLTLEFDSLTTSPSDRGPLQRSSPALPVSYSDGPPQRTQLTTNTSETGNNSYGFEDNGPYDYTSAAFDSNYGF